MLVCYPCCRPGTQRQTSSDGDSSEDDISSDYDDEDDDTRVKEIHF